MYDNKYYQNKKLELTQKSQRNVQRFINFVFDFVADAHDLTKRIKELEEIEKKSIKETKTGVKVHK